MIDTSALLLPKPCDQSRRRSPAIDTSLFSLPKPGHAAGRLILTGIRYSRLKGDRWEQQGRCCVNGHGLASPVDGHFHHVHGRGIGGGKRDDRDGVILCVSCHLDAKIERRESWIV